MKQICVVLAVAAACVAGLWSRAEAQVYESSVLSGQGQIVRRASVKEELVYMKGTNGMGYFVLVENGGMAWFELLKGMDVKDFEMDGNMVYFCGSMGSHALVGLFDYDKVFRQGGAYEYVLCNSSTTNENYYVKVGEFSRLDYFYDNGTLNLALIGSGVIDQFLFLNRTIVTSVNISGSTWNFHYYYNKDGLIRYTDIACLDNVVVAVGTDSNGYHCMAKAFVQQQNFPLYFLGGTTAQRIDFIGDGKEPLITRVGVDMAVVTHYIDHHITTVAHRLAFNSVTGDATPYEQSLFYTYVSTLPMNYFQMYDLRNDHIGQYVYVMEYSDMGTATMTNNVLEIPISGSPTSLPVIEAPVGRQVSFDCNRTISPRFALAGYGTGGALSVYYNMLPTWQCMPVTQMTVRYGTPTIESVMSNPEAPGTYYKPNPVKPTIYKNDMTDICH